MPLILLNISNIFLKPLFGGFAWGTNIIRHLDFWGYSSCFIYSFISLIFPYTQGVLNNI